MIQVKQLIADPKYNSALPKDIGNQPLMWQYKPLGRDLQAGDIVGFLCNGRGRGGHHHVTAKVTKVNKKTFKAIEWNRSYAPGTNWTVNIEHALEPGNGGITVDLSHKD